MCGNEVVSKKLKLPSSKCKYNCPGEPLLKCGGSWTTDVYETGLDSKCKPVLLALNLNYQVTKT